jgi:hypothetical protein
MSLRVWTVYDSEGKIRRILKGSEPNDVELMGCNYLEGEYSADEYHIKNGKPEKLPPENDSDLNQRAMAILRAERNSLLLASGWTQENDSPLSEEEKLEWRKYRQALRDLPQVYPHITDISEVTFPSKPGGGNAGD